MKHLLFLSLCLVLVQTGMSAQAIDTTGINGTWEVNFMQSSKSFNELYPTVKPTVIFKRVEGIVGGITGCNNFMGKFSVQGNKIKWESAFATTRKTCPDMSGEETFLGTIQKVNTYTITTDGKTLSLLTDDVVVMRFSRIK